MFKLSLVTPEKKITLDQEIDEVTVPAFAGELNILPGHAPLMTTLEAGTLRFKTKGSSEATKFAISWGYCQVSPDGVTVLAESAIQAHEIEIKVVEDHLRAHEAKLGSESLDDSQWENAVKEIARLRAEIEIRSEK